MSWIEIPRLIDPKEILVRSIKNPYHFDHKKNLPLPDAFTPPAGETTISLLRLDYTNPDFCKEYSYSLINPNAVRPESFAGLLIFTTTHIATACDDPSARALEEYEIDSSKPLADAFGTPMNNERPYKYIPQEVKVFSSDPGLPMHADMVYNLPAPERGVPNNPIKKLAKVLIRNVIHKIDTDPNTKKWSGERLEID